MQEFKITVSTQDSGRRLDLFLADFFNKNKAGYSRTFTQKLILEGKVKSGGAVFSSPHYKVKTGQGFSVIVEDKKADTLFPEDIPLDIVYEDSCLAVINKPVGLVVHPAPGNLEHTLVNALLARFKELSDINPARPGIVHRLDKETSGLLVVAKNNSAHLALSAQFAKHSIKRKYIAVVRGRVEFDENIIEAPIARHPLKRKAMAISFGEKSRYARTHYRTIKRADDFSLLELEPFTGRTHQLRVHLAFAGHPILGDTKYGKNNASSRLYLHAYYLGFLHPDSGKFMEFSCAVPIEFSGVMRQAKIKNKDKK